MGDGPTPLFGNTPSSEGPKSLDFGAVTTAAPNRATPAAQPKKEPGSLDFSSVKPVAATPSPTPRVEQHTSPVKQPGAIAFTNVPTGFTAAVDNVIAQIEIDHPSVFQANRLTARLNRLIPISIDKISMWGKQTLETNLLNEVVALTTRFSQMDGTKTLEDVLKATHKAPSMLSKIIKSNDPLSYTPQLIVLQQSLSSLRDECNEYHSKCEHYGKELMMDLICLSTAIDVLGTNNDVRVEKAVHDRKVLLTNANQQSQFVVLKVEQQMALIEQQYNQATQLLTVTLPAYQLARV